MGIETTKVIALQPLARDQATCAERGLQAAARSNWAALRAAQACASDKRIRDVLLWRVVVGDRNASFAELDQALRDLSDWPGLSDIRERAQRTVGGAGLTLEAQILWLRSQLLLSAEGNASLAFALNASDQAAALSAARAALISDEVKPDTERRLWTTFNAALSPGDIATRVTSHQWRGEPDLVRLYLDDLVGDERQTAIAWLAIASRDSNAFAGGPTGGQTPGVLIFAESQRLRRAGRDEDAARLALRLDPLSIPQAARAAVAQERRRLARTMLTAGDAPTAYGLVAQTGLDRGEDYADSEWFAGWVALRRLNNPDLAAHHFIRLTQNVSAPVSVARGNYWLALAERALGRTEASAIHLHNAAALPHTFFGHLADATGRPAIPATQPPSDGERAMFEANQYVQALRLLGQAGDRRGFELMALHLAGQLSAPSDYTLLADLSRQYGRPGTAVRAAKIGIRRGFVSLDAAFPIVPAPRRALDLGPEHALILAIARQESEWDSDVMSPVGARGLMQLMPTTAKLVSQRIGEPYRLAMLTADPSYNMTLGSAYLGQLIRRFEGSYVLAIAAYNAGPDRVQQWIAQYGDPRVRSVDTVDWIESIPFAETRNYVQRVLENLQVYRQRLGAPTTDQTLVLDLDRGAKAT